jgi:hypothetical protein
LFNVPAVFDLAADLDNPEYTIHEYALRSKLLALEGIKTIVSGRRREHSQRWIRK